MIKIIKFGIYIGLFIFTVVLVACSSGGGGGDGGSDGGNGAGNGNTSGTPQVQFNVIPDAPLLRNDSSITIKFNQSIDNTSGTWSLGGDLASESDGGFWSTGQVPSDTLTISPATTWSARPGRTLVLNALDGSGNAIATVTLFFDVYRGTLYYVDASMPDDSGDGLSPATARKNIHTAIEHAVPPAVVLVNAGDYPVNYLESTHVVLKGDVSLYGGYNSDFTERSPVDFPTTIEDVSNSVANTTDFNKALEADGNLGSIDSATLVDGFVIKGTLQPNVWNAAAVLIVNGASPTLNNNWIYGPDTSSQFGSGAVWIALANPILSNNRIFGGNGLLVAGVISDYGAEPYIYNNEIHGGNSTSSTFGIVVRSSFPTVRNNTIYSGSGSTVAASIVIQAESTAPFSQPAIDNNLIFSTDTPASSCIAETLTDMMGGDPLPASLRNNNLFACQTMYIDTAGGCPGDADGDNSNATCALEELNVLPNITNGVGGNISVHPDFVDIDGIDNDINTMDDNDWRLAPGTPSTITGGGLNGADQIPVWNFNNDADGRSRPASGAPWAIGAYEQVP